MPDALPIPREAVEAWISEYGVTVVPPGASGIFDEHGNYREHPLKLTPAKAARARQRSADQRRQEYHRLFDAAEPPERIAELLQVSIETVKQTAVKLGRPEAAGRTPRKAVVDNRKNANPTPDEGARESQGVLRHGAKNGGAVALAPLAVPPPAPEPAAVRGEAFGPGVTETPLTARPEHPVRGAYRACHAAGMSDGGIAVVMGVRVAQARRMLRALGLEPNPSIRFGSSKP